ncbi:MAG TPA: antitoxin Xre/MbcA/ParS toxin-binding domain-containing protein [Longimicrobiaceae bacterium]|nr:antitoxin Xre/MbcA/ParS toxin-binding domain-containing protein [Longimicrobiaceae bacterium]
MTISADLVAAVMGVRDVTSLSQLRSAVERGLPLAALDRVARHVAGKGGDVAAIKHSIVPRTTLARRTRLTREESERLERLARIIGMAESVWEDSGLAHEFLHSVQPALGGERPIDLARSDLGAREVEALLMKLEYGLPA